MGCEESLTWQDGARTLLALAFLISPFAIGHYDLTSRLADQENPFVWYPAPSGDRRVGLVWKARGMIDMHLHVIVAEEEVARKIFDSPDKVLTEELDVVWSATGDSFAVESGVLLGR